MRRAGRGKGRRSPESRRTGSWRHSDVPEVPPRRFLGLRETFQTVGVREREIGRIHAMCRSIRPRRDPALTIRGRSGLVSNESADTTNGEQHRCDERLSHQSGRGLPSCRSGQIPKSHARHLLHSPVSHPLVIPRKATCMPRCRHWQE